MRSNKFASSERWQVIVSYAPLFIVIAALNCANNKNDFGSTTVGLLVPDRLLDYHQFILAHEPTLAMKPLSAPRELGRKISFIGDLLQTAANNVATLSGKQLYLSRQNPFGPESTFHFDKSAIEILWRSELDDMTKFGISIQIRQTSLTSIDTNIAFVSGSTTVNPKWSGPELETGGRFSKFLKRKIKGDSHYEIPSFPLEQQPDPNKVTHIDADLRGFLGEIRNQNDCGACYAFSFNALLEWHYCKQSGKLTDFSEQYILDCGRPFSSIQGCFQGSLPAVAEFTTILGVALEKDYPYKAAVGKCQNKVSKKKVKVVEFKQIKVDRTEWEEVLKEQPILVKVHLPEDVLSYQRGIHPGRRCTQNKAHGMLLVGYGRQNGVPYWILRNSNGKSFGEQGYLRMARDVSDMSECFVLGFVGKFKFEELEESSYDDFYSTLKFEPTKAEELKRKTTKQVDQLLKLLNNKNQSTQT